MRPQIIIKHSEMIDAHSERVGKRGDMSDDLTLAFMLVWKRPRQKWGIWDTQ